MSYNLEWKTTIRCMLFVACIYHTNGENSAWKYGKSRIIDDTHRNREFYSIGGSDLGRKFHGIGAISGGGVSIFYDYVSANKISILMGAQLSLCYCMLGTVCYRQRPNC